MVKAKKQVTRLEGLMLIAFFRVLSVIIALGSFAVSSVFADDISRELKGCSRSCLSESDKCLSQAGVGQAFCDTHEISCASSCRACIAGFTSCMDIADHAVSFCQNVFAGCIDEQLNANASRAHTAVLFKGGDGKSLATAVVIEGALSDPETILAEDLWMYRHHPLWEQTGQTLSRIERRIIHKIEYQSDQGAQTIWFDITSDYGK